MRPWLAALMISMAPLVKAGYDPQSGVELVLTKEAKAAAKPIAGLETIQQQVSFFTSLTPQAELDYLMHSADRELEHIRTRYQRRLHTDHDQVAATYRLK